MLSGLAVAAFLAGVAAAPSHAEAQGAAPEPRRAVDVGRFYAGRWHEIARRPMWLTDGCVAGATDYSRGGAGEIRVLDSCRVGTPEGAWKTVGDTGTILDPGRNAKLRVDYALFGLIPVQRDYWVLDRAPDYSWFISADPTFDDLYIFARNPAIRPAAVRQLVRRARALGYDVRRLEFPAQPRR